MNLSFRDPIDEIANAYQASQILLTANRIGLFAAIGDEVKSADTVAADLVLKLNTNPIFTFNEIAKLILRGKQDAIQLFAINFK